jgi:hypothetical protein
MRPSGVCITNVDLIVRDNAPARQRAGLTCALCGDSRRREQIGEAVIDEARDRAHDRIAQLRSPLVLAGLACVGEREIRKDGISRTAAA